MKVLLIEDEDRLASFLDKGLRDRGYEVERVATGEDGIVMSSDGANVILLDLGLPDLDGMEVLQRIREAGVATPVVILTARSDVSDRVAGLEHGADDYLAKPFSFDELVARIHARLRVTGSATELAVGDIKLDLIADRAFRGDRWVELTAHEARLLATFLRNPGRILTRERLLLDVWGIDFDPRSNLVAVYVGYLRHKLGFDVIETMRPVGYRFPMSNSPSASTASLRENRRGPPAGPFDRPCS
jgi:two-component system, OmpR family, response regulator